jgi:hypothetical protein
MSNPDIDLTLDDAVEEVLGSLTGMDLTYRPELDRYRAITRCLNRALRSNALEHEWSYYATTASAGPITAGSSAVTLPATLRPRVTGDDAIRLIDPDTGEAVAWAYFLPRDALHKYTGRLSGLWASSVRDQLLFSRAFTEAEVGMMIEIPVMREPVMFRLPDQPEDPNLPLVTVDPAIRAQTIDFAYPDVITLRAAFYYAQTDPVMQPRVQTIEAQYKDLMYQVIERDDRSTESPFLNDFILPLQNGLEGRTSPQSHLHPHADTGVW